LDWLPIGNTRSARRLLARSLSTRHNVKKATANSVINTIALVIVFAIAYAQGGLVARAKGSVVTISCSKVTDRNSISKIQTEKVVITGTCRDYLDLSYLRTDSTLAFIDVKAREINLNHARLGGSLEIQDSFVDTITAVGADIAFDLTIYSTLVKDKG
jgi:hypothetical protein